jgi:hypothetical protein
MSIWKTLFTATLAIAALSAVVFAQGTAADEETVAEESLQEATEAEERVAAPVPASEPKPAPIPVAAIQVAEAANPVPAADPKPPAKPESRVEFYGAVQYRFRERINTLSADTSASDAFNPDARKTSSGTTYDYHNLFSWQAGLKAKVDDKLSFQLQIGNDWGFGEGVNWANNKAQQGRSYIPGADNLYVHLADVKWNPGAFYVEAGVIPVFSNGTLDLLERSINTGKYDQAIFQGWVAQVNNSLLGIKLGVPIATGGVSVGVELFQSILDTRAQVLTQNALRKDTISANPTSALFIFTLPVSAVGGDFKVIPEVSGVVNRNYNSTNGIGDHEIIGGLSIS